MALSLDEQVRLIELDQMLTQMKRERFIDNFFTAESRQEYKKQLQFFQAGKDYHQRLFLSANRVGKTFAMGCELVWHLTGIYPDWWDGKRFKTNQEWWVCGVDSESVKEVLQYTLLGQVGEIGTGLVPLEFLDQDTMKEAKRMETGIGSFRVKHITGTWSTVEFKSYKQGRQSFQGTARSIWLDEECPEDIYAECLTRTATGDNILVMTFTPLKGPTPLIKNFIAPNSVASITDGPVNKHKHVTTCTWDDVPHISPELRESLLASYPPHMRDARSKGIPALGSGVIYPVPQSEYVVEPFEIPKHWKRLAGMDVGAMTAAIWAAIDPDTKTFYIYHEYYKERQEPSIHATGILAPGKWIPIAIDPASRGRSQIDGAQLMQMYKDLGLKVNPAINAVETGLYDCWDGLSTGKIKIFKTCQGFLLEIQGYIRDEKGNVVKQDDHRMDAFRYGYMTRDIAKNELETRSIRTGNNMPSRDTAWA